MAHSNMFENLINKILGVEREPIPNRQDTCTAPDVTEKAVSSEPIPENTKETLKRSDRNMETLSKPVSASI